MANNETIAEREEALVSQGEAAMAVLHQLVHGDESVQVETEGGPVSSVAKWQKDTSDFFSDTARRADEALAAAFQKVDNYTSTAAAMLVVPVGGVFTVFSAESTEVLIYYRNENGVPVEKKRSLSATANTVQLNAGKPYPLKSMVRDGITSPAPGSIQNAFLDMKIIGARPGKLYRAEWIGTGTTALNGGLPNYELLITEYVKANYATNSALGAVPVISLYDLPATVLEAGDTLTRVFKSTRVEGIVVVLTYRPSALPAGASVLMNTPNTLAGWSWIIDENCYVQSSGKTDTELLALAKTASDASGATAASAALAAVSSLTLNAGKHFPLKQLTRNGVTSLPQQLFLNGILDIRIIGVVTGKYVKLSFYGNGTTAFGAPNYGMGMELFDAATFATASVSTPLTTYQDTNYTEVTANGVTTRTYAKTRVEGIGISITYLPAAFLPTQGSSIFTDSTSSPGYSWIVDPSVYVPIAALKETGLTINAGKSFPLKLATRAGITSAEQSLFRDGVLDIKAVGVPEGYFLRLGWYGNGTTAWGAPNYGMEFELVDAATYESTGASIKATVYTDASFEERVVSGTVVTRTYRATLREGLVITITYDKAVFAPSTGLSVSANSTLNAAYSWIVDPACYIPAAAPTAGMPSGPLVYSHTDTETLIAWRFSDTQDIRVAIGRYGVNQVNDIGAISFKTHGDAALSLGGVWTTQTTRSTDWIGPYIVNADANGSGSLTQFTGGNHGYTGAGGAPTGEQVYRKVFADGRKLVVGETGYAEQITFQWENLIQGSNTRDVPRNILREQHSFKVRPGSIETSARATALEALVIKRYYGLQGYTAGFNESVHFLNGQQSARVAWAEGLSSGGSGAYPNVWGANVRGASGFNLLMWVDRAYGIGKLTNLVAASDMFFTSSGKIYNRFIDEGKPLAMAAGESFCWRGGYAMAPNLGVGIDLGARYFDAGTEVVVAAVTAAGSGRVALPTPDTAGKAVTVRAGAVTFSERVEPDGIAVSAGGYAVGVAAT